MLTTHPFDDDKLREECGVFGIYGADSAAAVAALGLHALQHRGQEAAGITAFDGKEFHSHRAMGHVAGNFDRDDIIRQLDGPSAIGHVRYSTTGETALRNVQPLFADLATGGFAIAHNGNISNAAALRKILVRRGSIFQSTSDTEVIIHLVATSSYRTLLDRFIDALKQVEGAYSLICLTAEGMIGCRDPLGIRPLVIGKLNDAYILASETVALDVVGADFVRSVEPGELVIVRDGQLTSHHPFAERPARPCIFEYVYFSRPDSIVDGTSVYSVRKAIGAELARENPVDADLVIGAVLVPGGRAPIVVTEEMVSSMKKGAVIVDVAVDQGGCIATTKETSHSNPVFEKFGVVHYAVGNMPAAVPHTATYALTNATLPYVVDIARLGLRDAIQRDPGLVHGVVAVAGSITHQTIAHELSLPFGDVADALR